MRAVRLIVFCGLGVVLALVGTPFWAVVATSGIVLFLMGTAYREGIDHGSEITLNRVRALRRSKAYADDVTDRLPPLREDGP